VPLTAPYGSQQVEGWGARGWERWRGGFLRIEMGLGLKVETRVADLELIKAEWFRRGCTATELFPLVECRDVYIGNGE